MKPDASQMDISNLDQLPPADRSELLASSRRVAVRELGLGYLYALLIIFTCLLGFSIAMAPILIWDWTAMQASPVIGLGAISALFIYRRLERKILQRGYEALQRQAQEDSA
tara:strand:- start:988 stop:1320 length:333 start_codon:yes stop_codon:yes gene_type:complete